MVSSQKKGKTIPVVKIFDKVCMFPPTMSAHTGSKLFSWVTDNKQSMHPPFCKEPR
jgi:hypothetical protein